MKKMILTIVLLLSTLVSADVIEQNGLKNGYEVNLSTKMTPITGNNDFFVTLKQDGKPITDAKVKIKVFMPEMPGMPYMEYKAKAKLIGSEYKMMINFSMGGTCQYQLKFKTSDNKIHTLRGSVNI